MDLGVTIGAAVGIQLLGRRWLIIVSHQRGAAMGLVTLEAEKRHGSIEQGTVDGTMGLMAVHAVVGDIAMLIDERPLLFHVAAGTRLIGGTPLEEFILQRAMHVMAVGADQFLFPDGMVRRQGILRLHLRVAPITEIGHLLPAHLLGRPLVQFVAISAADVVQGMGAGVPVRQDRQ